MVANKMIGEKGVLFTAAYDTRFNDMEQILNQGASGSNTMEFEKHLIGAKYAIEILRVDEPSKVRMLTTVHEQHGVKMSAVKAEYSID